MVSEQYGEEQFMAWRRGYTVRPPPISSFSIHYPGNDPRYKLINDIRLSVSGTLMRSFDGGKLTLERKYPRSESLKDCMDRTIPYYEQVIVPEAIEKGKRVLIASSENVIRGLLMILCEIPEEKISGLGTLSRIIIVMQNEKCKYSFVSHFDCIHLYFFRQKFPTACHSYMTSSQNA